MKTLTFRYALLIIVVQLVGLQGSASLKYLFRSGPARQLLPSVFLMEGVKKKKKEAHTFIYKSFSAILTLLFSVLQYMLFKMGMCAAALPAA